MTINIKTKPNYIFAILAFAFLVLFFSATDKFGNIAVSTDYTVLAPVKRKSIIQIIINQFENIFGWTKGLGI